MLFRDVQSPEHSVIILPTFMQLPRLEPWIKKYAVILQSLLMSRRYYAIMT